MDAVAPNMPPPRTWLPSIPNTYVSPTCIPERLTFQLIKDTNQLEQMRDALGSKEGFASAANSATDILSHLPFSVAMDSVEWDDGEDPAPPVSGTSDEYSALTNGQSFAFVNLAIVDSRFGRDCLWRQIFEMADQRKMMAGGVIEHSPITRKEVCTDVDNPLGNIGADGTEQDWGPYSTAKRMVLDKHSWRFPAGAIRVRYKVFFKIQATVPGDVGFSNEGLICLPWWYQWDSDGVTGRLKIVVYSQMRGKSPCEGRLLTQFK